VKRTRAYVATMIQKPDQNSAFCGSALSPRPRPAQRPGQFFRELGSVVTVELKWSLEGVFPSRAVFKHGRASGNTLTCVPFVEFKSFSRWESATLASIACSAASRRARLGSTLTVSGERDALGRL
jgi:hypothetical protein